MTSVKATAIAVVGGLLVILGAFFGLIAGMDNLTTSARDADGYLMFDSSVFDVPSDAIVISDGEVLQGRFAIHASDSGIPMFAVEDLQVRLRGSGSDDRALFIGIAATPAVEAYLQGVSYDEIAELDLDVARVRGVEYQTRQGSNSPGSPAAETFWETSVEGAGILTLDWTVPDGEWTAVVMNADGSRGVAAYLVFGAKASNIGVIGWTRIGVGLIAVVGGAIAVTYGVRRASKRLDEPDDEIATRTQELMNSRDLSWTEAWRVAERESFSNY